MTELRRMTPSDLPAVQGLRVSPEQQAFVDPIDATLKQLEADGDSYVVVADSRIVGFFFIDTDDTIRFDYAKPGDLILQEFFIDVGSQGKGHGKAALLALPSRLAADYPGRPALVLTVNCRNTLAYRLYRATGFEDGGELHHGGRSGPQHILRLDLAAMKSRD